LPSALGNVLHPVSSQYEWVPSRSLDSVEELEGSTEEIQRIYFIRHGQSTLNLPDANGVYYTQGQSIPAPLTELGLEQAKELEGKLARKIQGLDLAILTSTAVRAQQTASVFLNHTRDPITSFAGLCEMGSGPWEGKMKDAAYQKELRKWEELSAKEKLSAPKVSQGETYDQVARRAMADLSKALPSLKGKTLFVFSHYMTIHSLAIQWAHPTLSEEPGTDLPDLSLKNCDILMVELNKGDPIEKARVKAKFSSHLKEEKGI
jgi:broad specificity phosphatase PhoE